MKCCVDAIFMYECTPVPGDIWILLRSEARMRLCIPPHMGRHVLQGSVWTLLRKLLDLVPMYYPYGTNTGIRYYDMTIGYYGSVRITLTGTGY